MAERMLIVAVLPSADVLARALHAVWDAGYRRVEALSTHPIPGLQRHGGFGGYAGALVVAILVAGLAFLVQYYTAVWAYPMDVSGKPVDAWAPLVPTAVVVGLMGAGVWALVAMLREAGLPRPHHPVFEADLFDLGRDRCYALAIEVEAMELPQLRSLLDGLGNEQIEELRL